MPQGNGLLVAEFAKYFGFPRNDGTSESLGDFRYAYFSTFVLNPGDELV